MPDRDEVVRPASRAEWRAWLESNHARGTGVFVVYPKARSSTMGPRYADVVEECLCFGWIDGTLRPVDDEVTSQWVAPRKPGSVWAASNRARVQRLSAAGRMTPAGEAAVARAKADGSWDALAEAEALVVADDLAAAFARHPGSRERYESFPPSQRQMLLAWVYGAKRPETRARRAELAAERSAAGLPPLAVQRTRIGGVNATAGRPFVGWSPWTT